MKPDKFVDSVSDPLFVDGHSIIQGNILTLGLSTRPGRMAARAWAYAYRAESVYEEEGMRVFNEIMKIVGEHEK